MDEGFPPLRPISHLLRENHIEDWEPRVLYQLLEFQYRSTKVLLNNAKGCNLHRKSGPSIVDSDVRLAVALERENEPTLRGPDMATARKLDHSVNVAVPINSESVPRMPTGAYIFDDGLSGIVEEVSAAAENASSSSSSGRSGLASSAPPTTYKLVDKYNVKRRKKISISTSADQHQQHQAQPMEQ